MKLVFASDNKKKLAEIEKLLPATVQLLSLADVGITGEIPETGDTFKANALQKAKYVLEKTGLSCFADDSGLEVEALDMRPGVYSARYAGKAKNDDANIDLLLSELKDKENRNAQFHTVIALLINGGTYFFEGIVKGNITDERRGTNGFGYDPVFIAEGNTKTFAEMTLDEKNKLSHRAQAVQQMISFLEKIVVTP
jgi:XTP/dITP diphosphohydrolase